MPDRDELSGLRAENARLIALLESHGIQWRPPQPVVLVAREPERSKLSTAEKVALFRRLFRGRTDVYPIRWEGKTSGKTGYAPACAKRMARRRLREATHQVRGLRQSTADSAVRYGDLRPSGR